MLGLTLVYGISILHYTYMMVRNAFKIYIQQIFIEHPLCAKTHRLYIQGPYSLGADILVEKTDIRKANK